MFKIWVKTVLDHRITKSFIFKKDEVFSVSSLLDYLIEICHEIDSPTPMVLDIHKRNFEKFNIVRFKSDDFVEKTFFDILSLEYVAE